MRVLAIIPARAGSKRLPGKNLKRLCGTPLIEWTINAAIASGCFAKTIVSTDSSEIAEIAESAGADVPFVRPKKLAEDRADTIGVVEHALRYMIGQGEEFQYFMLLQPTSPLREASDIVNSMKLHEDKGGDAVVSVCLCEHPPQWSNTLDDSLSMSGFLSPNVLGKRSQDLPAYYRLNGAIYLVAVDRFMQDRKLLLDSNCYAYVMSRESSVDIDTDLDFKLCESLLVERI